MVATVRHAPMAARAVWTVAALCSAHAWPATAELIAQVFDLQSTNAFVYLKQQKYEATELGNVGIIW